MTYVRKDSGVSSFVEKESQSYELDHRNVDDEANMSKSDHQAVIALTCSVPHKPWTLNLNGKSYHMANSAGETVKFILDSAWPQCKRQLAKAGINFNAAAQENLNDMGILRIYKNADSPRNHFFAIAAEGCFPEYSGFILINNGTYQKRKRSGQGEWSGPCVL